MFKPTQQERKVANDLVAHYESNLATFSTFLNSLHEQITVSEKLAPHIHSLKLRTKEPGSLKDKIFRKTEEAKKVNRKFSITRDNLFLMINDLAGLRILHLNTDQIIPISAGLRELFEQEKYKLFEKPTARTWDDESRKFFTDMGFKIAGRDKPSFYTSIHYVIKPNRKREYTCEIQVRTLMEEVWGEVDHRLNYPHKTKLLACREQLAALARATSSCSRLVDSIFRSHADLDKKTRR
jgi:ppGpp synthetase/RelA/SpoT-type nucleotidyltranferase